MVLNDGCFTVVALHGEGASADQHASARNVNETLRQLIDEGQYEPQQVFNMDESGLFWEKMLTRTSLSS